MSHSISRSRHDGRSPDSLRTVRFERHFTRYAEGSVLVCFGETQVLCTASVQESVPPFLRGCGQGWVTAEYGMLPRATHTRGEREAVRGKQSGRTQEIQRLIGRSLRAVTDLKRLGERSIHLDCDVLQADGGTRTAAITGAWVALRDAVNRLLANGVLQQDPLREAVAAVSVGIVRTSSDVLAQDQSPGAAEAPGICVLDLDYREDSACETDMNVVMTASGGLVEIQGTAEGIPFSRLQADALLDLAAGGIGKLIALQRQALQQEGGCQDGSA